jgi:hypothetical protein
LDNDPLAAVLRTFGADTKFGRQGCCLLEVVEWVGEWIKDFDDRFAEYWFDGKVTVLANN